MDPSQDQRVVWVVFNIRGLDCISVFLLDAIQNCEMEPPIYRKNLRDWYIYINQWGRLILNICGFQPVKTGSKSLPVSQRIRREIRFGCVVIPDNWEGKQLSRKQYIFVLNNFHEC